MYLIYGAVSIALGVSRWLRKKNDAMESAQIIEHPHRRRDLVEVG